MPDLLLQAMSAKHSGNNALAKQLLSQALIQDPSNEAAWMLMSDVVEDVKLRRNCLERVLAINPNNNAASVALAKLNTAPLSPITRGERDKPLNPPKPDRTPPFTPPFTWDDSQEQYLALGDLTYQAIPEEQEAQPPEETPPTFDWANDSDEPDETIQKIFTAVSNPELASIPLPEQETSVQDENQRVAQGEERVRTGGEAEDRWLNELVGPDEVEETLVEPQPAVTEDFRVNAESRLGLEAFTTPEQPVEPVTSDYLLWDNPRAKTDRLVILSNKALIYASPKPSDIPHILGLFSERKMVRDLLGEDARMIKLDTVKRLTTCPATSQISIDFLHEAKLSNHQVTFASPQVRDEVMRAFQIRLGANSTETMHSFKLVDKITPPLVVLLFLSFLAWAVVAGLPMLIASPETQSGPMGSVVSVLQNIVSSVGINNIIYLIAFCGLLTLVWLVNNLIKPSSLVVVEYH